MAMVYVKNNGFSFHFAFTVFGIIREIFKDRAGFELGLEVGIGLGLVLWLRFGLCLGL
jgi:hypothetical protein